MKFVKLTRVIGVIHPSNDPDDEENFRDDEPQEQERTVPVVINAECIRSFNSRRGSKPGTRITFSDGGGFPVTESIEEVTRALMGTTRTTTRRESAGFTNDE